MLLTKEVRIKCNPANKKHLKTKGYMWEYNKEILVKIEDLSNGSNVEVEVECDNCHTIKNIRWTHYIKCVKEDKKYYCHKCAHQLQKGKVKTQYKYNINDVIKDVKSGQLMILKQTILSNGKYNQKAYKYKCLICGNEDYITETNLIKKNGCNVCANMKILKGYNDLWTTHPQVAKLLKYPEKGFSITYGNDKKEWFVCPNCNYEKMLTVNQVIKYGFSCNKCSDGISYPNKFAFSLLEQIGISFISEYSPNWIKPKRYDFYFELNNQKYIIEMDGGLGHGSKNKLNNMSAEESLKIDNYKDELAKLHNIKVIRIDSKKSELEYIKNNILNSELSSLFDLSHVDWLKCHEFACNSLVKITCNLWNKIKNIRLIEKQLKISHTTITNYLKQGSKLGWCTYTTSKGEKPIVQISLNNKYIREFKSIREAEIKLKINSSMIVACCKSKRKQTGGFKWMYKEDWNNYIKQQNNVSA